MYFEKEISGWKSWGGVFQDKEAFTPLAMAILTEAGFPALPLENLSPGTNAVFRSGNVVIKIYVPMESGLDTRPDWLNEQAVMERAAQLNVPSPRLLAAGEKQDKYLFRWIIMEFCPGREAGDALPEMTAPDRAAFARQVRALLNRLNQPAAIVPRDLKQQAMENERFDCLHPRLVSELKARAQSLDLSDSVLVHGDCTGENLLVNDGQPILIDFADCCLAPAWYELPAAVFELFHCDREAVDAFRGREDRDIFLRKLLDGLCIHDFGGNILHDFFEREGIAVDEISSVRTLEALLKNRLFGEKSLPEVFPSVLFPPKTGDLRKDAEKLYLAGGKQAVLEHVLRVAETAERLAVRFGADPALCKEAALLHDLAAILPREEMKQAALDEGAALDPAEERYPLLLHQRFSSVIAREWLGIRKQKVLSAIRCHTTLKAAPSPEEMVVFLADKISWDQPGTPPFLPEIEAGLSRSLEAGCLAYLDHVMREGKLLCPHPWLLQAHQWLKERV